MEDAAIVTSCYYCRMDGWLVRLRENKEMVDRLMRERNDLIVAARLANVPVTKIAVASALSRAQVHRILNESAPTLRLVGPTPDGMWEDSTGVRRPMKPDWLVAAEGTGSVRGWFFNERDAIESLGIGEYHRRVEHKTGGLWV